MFNYLKNFIKPIPIGRWGNIHDKEKKIIKQILANSDNYGDLICGYPDKVKYIIENQKRTKNLIHQK